MRELAVAMTKDGSVMASGLRALLSGSVDVLEYDAATEVLGAVVVAIVSALGGSRVD